MTPERSEPQWVQRVLGPAALVSQKALQLDRYGRELVECMGEKSLALCAVAFVDIVGFTTRVRGYSPKSMAEYLSPFFAEVLRDSSSSFVIDKTIGDEVMFVVKLHGTEFGALLHFMDHLGTAALSLNKGVKRDYPLRAGIAIGPVHLARIRVQRYEEWTVVGETVNRAKRILSIGELDAPKLLGIAIAADQSSLSIRSGIDDLCAVMTLPHRYDGRSWQAGGQETVDLRGVTQTSYRTLDLKRVIEFTA